LKAEPDPESQDEAGAPSASAGPGPAGSRDKILDIGEALFARRGYAGVGLREVAARVGLGKSSLFHHFRSKGSLYLCVLQRVFERIDERVRPSLDGEGTPAERLERCVDALIDALAEHPATGRLLLRGLFEDDDLPAESEAELAETERALERLLGRLPPGLACARAPDADRRRGLPLRVRRVRRGPDRRAALLERGRAPAQGRDQPDAAAGARARSRAGSLRRTT
jgi:AcrR family transcriptional regulator